MHDKKIADQSSLELPKGSTLHQDKGFQGFKVKGVKSKQAKKKPRGKELSEKEKKRNRQSSSERMRIEHVVGSVKRYRIVKEKMKVWKKGFRDLIMETCCGLHNFRLYFRPWDYGDLANSTSL